MIRSYCICYYFPNHRDYYYKDNNKPLSKNDWVYSFVKLPKNRDEMMNSFIKLQGDEIIYVLDTKSCDDNEYFIVTFMTKDLKKRYLLTSRDGEIIDPVSLTTYCRLVELEKVKNERVDD
jgi:hypothetical protein